jgi:steroid delta-isomerase-like uncharacterized protein
MDLAKVVITAACLLLAGVDLNRSKDQNNVDYNVSVGRQVFEEVYGEDKVDLVDQFYANDFVDDSPGGGKGRDLIKQAVTAFHKAFPDLRIEIEDAFGVDDKVVLRYTARGTQTGAYYDIPPSGKTVAVRGITIFQIVNGRIKTEWTEYDRLGVMQQIGVVSSD